VRAVVDNYRAGLRAVQLSPEIEPFAERNGGFMILFSLIVAAGPGDTVPPSAPVRISISELARRFSVSRTHVLQLLRDAARQGLIERAGHAQEAIILLPPLRLAIRHCAATLFLFFAHCARAAMTEVGARNLT
jgi:hypothetical protein